MSINRDTSDWGQYQPQRKNLIINGGFNVWQYGTSISPTVSGELQADRFSWRYVGAGTITYLQSTNIPAGTDGVSLRLAVNAADVSIAASDWYHLIYNMEGYDFSHLAFGTTAAKDMTISFWIFATKTGTQSVSFRNSASDRAYIATYTVNVSNTWEYKTITIPGETTGTWLDDNGIGLRIGFAVAIGSDTHASVDNTWLSGVNVQGSASGVNNMDNAVNEFRVKNVQLEIAPEATDFEIRHYGDELALCQRYYQKSFRYEDAPSHGISNTYLLGGVVTAISIRPKVYFPAEMRSAPTVTTYRGTVSGTDGDWQFNTGTWVSGTTTVVSAHQKWMMFSIATTGKSVGDSYECIGEWTAEAEL